MLAVEADAVVALVVAVVRAALLTLLLIARLPSVVGVELRAESFRLVLVGAAVYEAVLSVLEGTVQDHPTILAGLDNVS